MKDKKRFVFFTLLAMIWLCSFRVLATETLPTDVQSPSSGCVLLGLEGKYITQIPQALNRINEIRKEACQEGVLNPNTLRPLTMSDYRPIKWSSDLEYIARIRAAEASLTMAHKRTNGKSCFAIQSPAYVQSYGEVIAWNLTDTMVAGIEQWYAEKEDWVTQNPKKQTGHYTQMIDPNNSYIGLGTFCSKKALSYNTTVGEFNSSSGLDETQGKPVDDCIQILEFSNSYCNGNYAITGNLSSKANEKTQLKLTTGVNLTDYWGSERTVSDLQVLGSVNWTSSDNSVAFVDFNGLVTAYTCGTAKITAQDSSGHMAETEFEIKHTEVIDKKVQATCKSEGLTEGKHCSVCGKIIVAQKTIPSTSHKWDEGKIVKQPTNTSTGEKKYTCVLCHTSKTEEIPALSKDIPGKAIPVEISAISYNKICLKWKKALNATDYFIYYKKTGSDKWIKLASVKGNITNYTHISSKKYPIVVGEKYSYTVRSYNNKSKKYGSYDKKGLSVKTVPSTPKLGKAVFNSDRTVTVTWKKSGGCNYYKIYRKTSSSEWKQIGSVKSSNLSFKDKTPVPGTNNIYTVKAYYSKTKVSSNYDSKGISVKIPEEEKPETPGPSVPAAPTPIPIPPNVHPVLIRGINLSRHSITLTAKGQRVWIDSIVLPGNAYYPRLGWVSSNPSVAKVEIYDKVASSESAVTAVSNGTTVITAYALDGSGITASCNVTVKIAENDLPELPPLAPEYNPKIIKVKAINLSKTSVKITDRNQDVMIDVGYSPSNVSWKGCRWTSSNTSVALVNNGWPDISEHGYVDAVGNGTAIITAHAIDGSGVTAQCVVTVNIS
ncbi:MAG: Ig-like domain-containing protein [Clostridia bacterium]|nr:Ig-like domain-containing protein [Clostridia bacterium]MDY5556082.1 Ig-like domain-containing protein [Blautia sp.]